MEASQVPTLLVAVLLITGRQSPGHRSTEPKAVEPERQQDPERHGVAVLIDVDSVAGAGENGFFQQARD
jgi:hypothetical protein